MSYAPPRSGRAYWLSVFIGAYVGFTLSLVVGSWQELVRPDPSELWTLPWLIFVYGLFAVPFVAVGLGVFGLPVTALLRRRANEWKDKPGKEALFSPEPGREGDKV